MPILFLYALINAFTLDEPKWQELSAFEMYPTISISKFHQMSDADIQKLPYKSADLKEAQKVLSMAKVKLTPIIWKGTAILAIAKFKDGSSRKVLINTYGSSFRDVTGKKDYTLESNADSWHSFISKHKP